MKTQEPLFLTWLSAVTWLSVYKLRLPCRPPSCRCDQMQNCEGGCETIYCHIYITELANRRPTGETTVGFFFPACCKHIHILTRLFWCGCEWVLLVDLICWKARNVLSYEVFWWICTGMGSLNKCSLVAPTATLGNFFYLHKSKMAAGCNIWISVFELLIAEQCVVPLFWHFWVRWIRFWCYFCICRSRSRGSC